MSEDMSEDIPAWTYLRELDEEREELLAAVVRVMDSGRLILGDEVRRFEAGFAAWCGVGYGVGVGNGTDALVLALRALGIGRGDEVVSVANTAVPTIAAIVEAGATPRFVDIEADTCLLDASRLERAIGPNTRAIVAVHLYGQCVDMDAVRSVAEAHGLRVIEDCAQAHGATYRGRRCGGLGDLATFSFYPTKVLGTFGDGGMVVGDDAELLERVRQLRFYGMRERYFAEIDGVNSRLDELHAAILSAKLARLDGYLARRAAIAAAYGAGLASSSARPLSIRTWGQPAWYHYVVRHRARDRIVELLAERGIHCQVAYRWPIHVMPPYRDYAAGTDLRETEAAAREVFSLPIYPGLSDDEVERVCTQLREVLTLVE